MKFDLHVHTTYSDGIFNPMEVVDLAVTKGLDGIAITDHDTIRGVEIAINKSKEYNNFYIIPGIEFGCVCNNEEVHILGYFMDLDNIDLVYITNKLQSSRTDRAKSIINRLKELDIIIDYDDVKKLASNNNIGRPHIARTMIEKGYVKDIKEAFDRYLDRGKPAYVDRYHLTIKNTIELIHKSNGISVLAHPGLLKDKTIVDYCIDNGIDGIECYHSNHTNEDEKYFRQLAKEANLIITGGSDFHGDRGVLGDISVNLDNIPRMKERINNE